MILINDPDFPQIVYEVTTMELMRMLCKVEIPFFWKKQAIEKILEKT